MSKTIKQYGSMGNWSYSFNLPTSGVAGEGVKWGHVPRGTSTHFIQPFKNAVLSRNLEQNMLKNAHFWKKSVKSSQLRGFSNPRWPPAAGSSAPKPPHCYFRLLLYSFCRLRF